MLNMQHNYNTYSCQAEKTIELLKVELFEAKFCKKKVEGILTNQL